MDARAPSTSVLIQRVLAPNPGPMTLDGTNSYVLGSGSTRVVIDPGPLDSSHLAKLSEHPVELVLITHHHADHTAASVTFARDTGAPVRALDPAFCVGGDPLVDGEEIFAADIRIRVVATPGHTADSVSFFVPDHGEHGSVLTGDTVLGRGTTVILHPDGNLTDYLASLERLREFGNATVLPAHGPALPSLADACDVYVEHRMRRLDQVREALKLLGLEPSTRAATVGSVTDAVYGDTPAGVRFAAEASVRAQLEYLGAV